MAGLVLRGAATTLALTVLACVGLYPAPALPQSNDKTTDIEINGVPLRIPREYVDFDTWRRIAPDRYSVENGKWKGEFVTFRFWLSDGKPPLTKLEYSLAEPWPPDPGRPSQSAEDFVVHVFGARFLANDVAERLRSGRHRIHLSDNPAAQDVPGVHGMACRSQPGRYLSCISPPSDDPAIQVGSAFLHFQRPKLTIQLLSRADVNLELTTSIPAIGLERVPDVVCRILWFFRTWRVSEGPAAPNCSGSRVSMRKEFRVDSGYGN